MRIGIIGAGFSGLSAAYYLSKNKKNVTVFEKDALPGGLAIGYKEREWQWSLEQHYHHWFTNDTSVLALAQNLNHAVITQRPKTSVYVDSSLHQLDSPLNVLQFPKLSFVERLRMGAALGALRYNPFWKPLEKFRASDVLPKLMGKKPYDLLWEPLLSSKFGKYKDEISLAWFWARIKKRTSSLVYPQGGFLAFAQTVAQEIAKQGTILFNTEIKEIENTSKHIVVAFTEKGILQKREFDKIIVTVPSSLFIKIVPNLPTDYRNSLLKLKSLGAVNMILRLRKEFLTDNTYWLSVCERDWPIMAIVEHTHFMDKKYYNNEHLVYLGNYVSLDDKRFAMGNKELLALYDPFLKKINPSYKEQLIGYSVFKTPFAQPIIPTYYSKMLPPFETPLKNIFLANVQQVYPWDRGTNYAVELGEKIAKIIQNK